MRFTHIHSSSRYDRSLDSLRRAAESYNKRAQLVTYTEVEYERREQVLRNVGGDEWGLVSGDRSSRNDGGITYRNDRFVLLHEENPIVLKEFAHPIFATIAVFRDKVSNKKFVVAVVHLPASVEGDMARNITTARTVAWHRSFAGTRRRANKLARRYKTNLVMITGDFNLDFKKPWVRALIKASAPRFKQTWYDLDFPGGTHRGGRVIDATLLRGRKWKSILGAKLLKDDDSSDHRPFFEIITYA